MIGSSNNHRNIYQEHFSKYANIAKEYEGSYEGLAQTVLSSLEPLKGEFSSHAIVVMGFSGNGKSTWISNFCFTNSEYCILSMDQIVRELYQSKQKKITNEEIVEYFGEKMDNLCSQNKKIIVDGNFLNLLTRCALTDTLHTYGYRISLVDLTDKISSILPFRILEKSSERLGVSITTHNYQEYQNHPIFLKTQQEIINYYYFEKKRSNIEEQIQQNLLLTGVDDLFSSDTPMEEIKEVEFSFKK